MRSLRLTYTVEASYDDEPPEIKVFRFPSKPWWGCVVMLYLGRLAAIAGPARLKGGTIVTRLADGSVEYLERRKPDA